jgi:hypothetical protein
MSFPFRREPTAGMFSLSLGVKNAEALFGEKLIEALNCAIISLGMGARSAGFHTIVTLLPLNHVGG